MLDQDRLAALAESVADKTPSDWLAAEAGARDARERRLVSHLRAVAEIGRARASLDVGSGPGPPAVPPGARWGDLRILERLGQGRFGDVYRAWDPALDREVALKLLRHADVGDDLAAAVVDEGRLMARVRHPNVATIYGARRIDGTTGLWMELLAGPTLAAELRATGPFDAAALTDVARALCDALQAVHDAGLVHRDEKAQNVLRDATGRLVLGDFGTGRELADSADARQGLAGTPAYIAPEIYAGQPATPRSDLYSLGVLLFHLATGAFPVAARTLGELRTAHVRGEQQALAAARGDLPAAITAAIDRALDPDPQRRFASARDMAAALAPPAWRGPRLRQAAVSVVALVTTVGLLAGLSRPTAPAVPVPPGSAVLVADIQNDSGEALLDGTVRFALERELAAVAPVASRGRVDDALALMRRPLGTPLDSEVAREVALRDGAIAAVIGGRVERLGTRYAVTVEVRLPDDGMVVASLHEPSLQLASLLDGIRRLSAGVRRHLGDRAAASGSRPAPMPRVTTSSLRALQLYAKAYDGLFERNPSAASATASESLLREAILADPGFADAHRMLAIAVRVAGERSGRSRLDEARGHADRALELAQTAGVSERIRSQGEWHAVRFFANPPEPHASEHARGVLASCKALLELHPDDLQALMACVGFHELIGDPNPDFAVRLADVRPLSPHTQVAAARALLAKANDLDRAQRYLARAVALPLTEETAEPVTIARLFAARQAWVENRPHDALRIAEQLRAEFDATSGAVRAAIARPLWSLYLDLGQLARAEEIAAANDNSVARRASLAIVAVYREDTANLRRVLRRLYPRVEEAGNVVSAFVEARLLDEARRLIAAQWTQVAPRPPGFSAYVRMIDGHLSLVEGRHGEAVETLTAQIQELGSRQFGPREARLSRLLADALAARGDLDRAISVLEGVPPRQVRVMGWPLTQQAEWLQVRDRLATLYRRVSRTANAVAVEAELRMLLQFADDDHPIGRRLRERAATITSTAVVDSRRGDGPVDVARGSRAETTRPAATRGAALLAQALDLAGPEGGVMQRPHLVEQLAREALAEDPAFVMAQVVVARALTRQGKLNEALSAAERAVAVAARGSEIDRLVARAELDSLRGGMVFGTERLTLRRASAAGYEAVVALAPGHDWALMCLSGLYPELGRPGDALGVAERLATLHPHSLTAMWRVALAADRLGNTAMARRYVDRGNRLDGAIDERNAYQAAWLRLFPARQAWLEGDVVAASRVVAQAMREMDRLTPAAQEGFALELVPHLLALGQLARAELAAARLPAAARGFYMSRIATPTLGHAVTAADRSAGRAVIRRYFPDVSQATNIISAYVLVDDMERARQAMRLLETGPSVPPGYLRLVRAHLAMVDNRADRVVELLDAFPSDDPPRGSRMWAMTTLTLANAHVMRGDHWRAIEMLDDATHRRGEYDAASAHAWLPLRHRLAELYRTTGRAADAEAAEAELRGLLAVADDGHPIRRRLAAPAPAVP